MPTYQYRCTECGRDLEAVQKFTDAALTECPSCDGQLRKVYNAVGVVFKGSGFYRTDSRSTNGSGESGSGDGTKTESTTGSKESGAAPVEKAGSSPAAAKTGAGSGSSANGSSSSSTAAKAAP